MGYKAPKKLYKLIFADEAMDGLEVIATSASMESVLRIQELSGTKGPAATRELVGILAKALLSWNLEDDDDQPVPCTVEGMLTQDPDWIQNVTSAWVEAVTGVSAPLDGGSTSGATSALEASMPMEPLSSSQASSGAPVSY